MESKRLIFLLHRTPLGDRSLLKEKTRPPLTKIWGLLGKCYFLFSNCNKGKLQKKLKEKIFGNTTERLAQECKNT